MFQLFVYAFVYFFSCIKPKVTSMFFFFFKSPLKEMVLAREGNEKENKQNLNKRTPGLWDTQVVGMQRVSRRPRQIHPTWALLLKVHSMSFLVGRQGDRFKTHTRLLSTFNGSDCYATCLHLVFNKDFKGSIKQKKGHFEINRLWFFFFFYPI